MAVSVTYPLLVWSYTTGTHSVNMDQMNKNYWLHSHNINIKCMVKKLACACTTHSAVAPSAHLDCSFLSAQATPESFVVGSILIALNNRDSIEAYDYQLDLRNLTRSGIFSDFKSLLSRLAHSSSAAQGVRRISATLKCSFVTEGHLLCFISFCSRDYVQITNEENQVFGKYCGHMTGKTVLVSGKYGLIKFHSHSDIQNRGFLMTFSAVVPPCKKW